MNSQYTYKVRFYNRSGAHDFERLIVRNGGVATVLEGPGFSENDDGYMEEPEYTVLFTPAITDNCTYLKLALRSGAAVDLEGRGVQVDAQQL